MKTFQRLALRTRLAGLTAVVLALTCLPLLAASSIPIAPPEGEQCIPADIVVISSVTLLDEKGEPIGPAFDCLAVSGDTVLGDGEELPLFSPLFEGDGLVEAIFTNTCENDVRIEVETGQTYDLGALANATVLAAGDPTHKAVCQCICNNGAAAETITLPLINNACKFYKGKECEMATAGLPNGKVKQSCDIVLKKC